jgi:hypothetical protein
VPISVVVKSQEPALQARREKVARRVVDHFGGLPPDDRLLCFFDDEDWQLFKTDIGKANRGLYGPIQDDQPWAGWPEYVTALIFVDDLSRIKFSRVFEHIIYLHGSTCSSDIGLAMTFAHELQHYVQYSTMLKIWAESVLIRNLLATFDDKLIKSLGLKWSDIPTEREARAVSKRIAELLFGNAAVRKFIDMKIAERVTEDDAADWQFVQDLNTATPYVLEEETRRMFWRLKEYRLQFQALLEERKDSPYFVGISVDSLLEGAGETGAGRHHSLLAAKPDC